MRKKYIALAVILFAWCGAAEPVCVNGVCYPDEESARAAGALLNGAPHLPGYLPGTATKHVAALSPSDLSVTTNVPVQTESAVIAVAAGTGGAVVYGVKVPQEGMTILFR